jgi:hypothetical protein
MMLQGLVGVAGVAATHRFGRWTALAESLAMGPDLKETGRPKNLIFLWLQGGPSQLETFDPHPDSEIGGPTQSIATSTNGLEISDLLPRTAEIMHTGTLIRSMVSKEGDHERASYAMKTGWRPDPVLVHPSIGSILCHQTQSNIEIPRHVSILSSEWPARGGYLGASLDAFLVGDPENPIENLEGIVDVARRDRRLHDLESILETEFRRGRLRNLETARTLQSDSTTRARNMMDSQQIVAFETDRETKEVRDRFGNTPFGRGCLAALRLIEVGVRCVEVELSGWDTHANNFGFCKTRCEVLDAAIHGLLTELQARELLDDTVVVCGGEFGRTPKINIAEGRDHWPVGFSTALFGGPFRRGYVHGATTSELLKPGQDPMEGVTHPVTIEDLHATVLSSFGVDVAQELQTPIGRPLAISQGRIVRELFQ